MGVEYDRSYLSKVLTFEDRQTDRLECLVSNLEYGVLYEAEDDEKYRDEKQVEGVVGEQGEGGPSVL